MLQNSEIKINRNQKILIKRPRITQTQVEVPFILTVFDTSEEFIVELAYDECVDTDIFDEHEQINETTVYDVLENCFIEQVKEAFQNCTDREELILNQFGEHSVTGQAILAKRSQMDKYSDELDDLDYDSSVEETE